MKLQELQEREQKVAQELSRAKEKNMTLIEDNRSLASQLVFYQEDAKTTSENLVIKDAEVMLLVMVAGSFNLALTRFCAPRFCHPTLHYESIALT